MEQGNGRSSRRPAENSESNHKASRRKLPRSDAAEQRRSARRLRQRALQLEPHAPEWHRVTFVPFRQGMPVGWRKTIKARC